MRPSPALERVLDRKSRSIERGTGDTNMKRTPVNSSLIASVGLEDRPDGPVMEIEFVNGKGSVYQYTGPKVREHHDALLKAPSVGQYFLKNVKTCPHTKFNKV
jgi:hypothetical protein